MYEFLSVGLQSDQDILAAFLAANPEHFGGWANLLGLIPVEVQLQHPELVCRILNGHIDCEFGAHWSDLDVGAIAPDLWRNREVLLAWIRCGMNPPDDAPAQFEHDHELWLQVSKVRWHGMFKSCCPATLCSDRSFMLRAVRANPERCLEYLTGDHSINFDRILTAMNVELAEKSGD